jgi:hypothetical protein
MLEKLYWFRAFRHPDPRHVEAQLYEGLRFNPAPDCETAKYETALAISPRQVYAYLGLTREEFGDCAVALPGVTPTGAVSPFDSGTLVTDGQHSATWPPAEVRAFLESCSWPSAELPSLLPQYPGTDPGAAKAYLEGTRPTGDGPHTRFNGVPESTVWRDGPHTGAWLWELRVPGLLQAGAEIALWTAPDAQQEKIIVAARERNGDWALQLQRKYMRGIGEFLNAMRDLQVQQCNV